MFFKIALKNVTRSLRDYSVYFLTLTFGVCLFYVFNSLESQWVFQSISNGNQARYVLQSILTLVDMFSVFVSVILAFLMLYANNFMVKRRKKELGIYLLLGLSQGRISSLLFLETLFIGALSLGAGLLLGVFLSQFISVFTAGLFQITLTEFHFVFSLKAVGKTLLYFGIIFLLVMVFNSFAVSRTKLIDLLQAERKNEDLRSKSLRSSVVLFLLSLILLGVAYWMLLARGLLRIDTLFFVMLGLGSLGTLFFFRALSGFLLRVFQANQKLYYKGINMFTLRQFASRVGSNYVSMTVICLMLLLAIGITACSVGMNNTLDNITNQQAPYDFFLSAQSRAPNTDELVEADVPATLKKAGFDTDVQLSTSAQVTIWYADVTLPQYADTEDELLDYTGIISLSTYNAMRGLTGQKPIALEANQYGQTISAGDNRTEIMQTNPVLELQGHALAANPNAVFFENLSIRFSTESYFYLIVPDEVLAYDGEWSVGKPLTIQSYFCGNYRTDVPKEETEALLQRCVDLFTRLVFGDSGGSRSFNTKLELYAETMGSKILVLFLGIYLGIVFLLCSAAVLALQQLSQANDNAPRYRILSRLGVSQTMRDKAVYTQVLLAFLLPLLLALIHAVVGMTAANAVIASVGKLDSFASSMVTLAFIVIFYGAYLLATCLGSRRIARGR